MKQFRKYWLLLLIAATLPTQMWGKNCYAKVTTLSSTKWVELTYTTDQNTGANRLIDLYETTPVGTLDLSAVYSSRESNGTNYAGTKIEIHEIAANAFKSTTQRPFRHTKVVLPSTLLSIGNNAFDGCAQLELVTTTASATSSALPASLKSIGEYAFQNCKALKNISLSAKSQLESIGQHAFIGCTALTTVGLGNATLLTTLGNYAFKDCSALTSVTLPTCMVEIGNCAFQSCSSLTTVNWTNLTKLTTINNSAFSKCAALTSVALASTTRALTTLGSGVFSGCTSLKTATLPATLANMGEHVFYGCNNLTSVTFTANSALKELPAQTFYECTEMQSFTLPAGFRKIKENAFYGCERLTTVTLPTTLEEIEDKAFEGCVRLTTLNNLNKLTLLTTVGEDLFLNCSGLTTITLPGCIETIPILFTGCTSLASVTLNEGITEISQEAFSSLNALTTLSLPKSLTTIGKKAFVGCSNLKTVNWTGMTGLTSMGDNAFGDCTSLTEITILGSLETVPADAFNGCTALAKAVFSEGVTTIGKDAFKDCASLQQLTIPTTMQTLETPFTKCQQLATIDLSPMANPVNIGSYNGLKALTSVKLPENLKSIGTFTDCTALPSIVIPEGVKRIPVSAFEGCTALSSVTLPTTLASISDRAFFKCTSLTALDVHDNLTAVGDYAFYGCTSLKDIVLPELTTFIGREAFAYCKIERLTIAATYEQPEGYFKYTHIGGKAFAFNDNLKEITILRSLYDRYEDQKESYGMKDSLCWKCPNLETVTIGPKVGMLSSHAFDGCTGLKTLNIMEPEGDMIISEYAFSNCTSLPNIILPETEHRISIGNHAFQNTSSATKVVIPHAYLYSGALAGCGVEDLQLGNVTTSSNENNIFENCTRLKTVVLPESMEYIGKNMFAGCTSLEHVTFPSAITKLPEGTFKGCTAMKELPQSDIITSYGDYCFAGCTSLPAELVIPDIITSIGNYAFSECTQLTSAIVPGIGEFGFSGCPLLTEVTVTKNGVGDCAFNGCEVLSKLTVKGGTVGSYLFSSYKGYNINITYPQLTNVTLEEGVTGIGKSFVQCTSLTSVDIPSTVTSWEQGAFNGCDNIQSMTIHGCPYIPMLYDFSKGLPALSSVTIEEGVLEIKDYAFSKCPLISTIELPKTLTTIGKYAFRNCSALTSITIPDAVTSIQSSAFSGCTALAAVNITKKSQLSTLGGGAFQECEALKSFTFPATLTRIEANDWQSSFYGTNLETIISYAEKAPNISSDVFPDNYREITTLYVPYGSKQDYTEGENYRSWAYKFKEIIEMEKESLAIDEENFPDEKLRAYLLSQSYGEDAKLTDEEIMGLTSLNVSGQGIKSLQGIRFLTGLDVLDIHNNPISTEAMNSLIKELTVCTSEKPNILMTVDKNYEGQGVECNDMHVYAAQQKGWKIQYADGSDMTDAPAGTGGATGVKGDVTGDGVVDIADAVHIVNFIVGKVDALAPRQEVNQPNPE